MKGRRIVEIIKYPVMTLDCPRCQCEFKFDVEDVKECGGSGRKRQPRQYLGVSCPICKQIVEVWSDYSYSSLSIPLCKPTKQKTICHGSLSECPVYLQNQKLWFDRGVVYKRIEDVKCSLVQNIRVHPGFETAIEMINKLLEEIRRGYVKEE